MNLVAVLKTAAGTTKRAASKLCLLTLNASVEGPSYNGGGCCAKQLKANSVQNNLCYAFPSFAYALLVFIYTH